MIEWIGELSLFPACENRGFQEQLFGTKFKDASKDNAEMDNRSGEMFIFVRVVQTGSFSGAAKTLDLSPSAVSKLITRLEARLATLLFLRSTRELVLTTEGKDFYESALRILEDIDEAEQAIGAGSTETKGVLRVNASLPFGTRQLLPLLPEFRARYPLIDLDLSFTDQVVDMTKERVDVAVRVGKLSDASYKARLLGLSRYAVVASPDYLASNGTPAKPSDLHNHVCLGFNFRRSVAQWPFLVEGEPTALSLHTSLLTNNGETMLDLTLMGMGISRLGRFHVDHEIEAGRLVEILPGFNPGDVEELHAVFPAKRHMARRVRVFIDFLAEKVAPRLEAAAKPRD
ncbi:MAG: LysR substrate-binding domain-containing protein [Achromobacter marplatensis]|uniref:LysR substrate-binding domain-containing protein n=1 Tax=Achromobacter marplatensis TaxID=470868 RepID=UPI003D091C17